MAVIKSGVTGSLVPGWSGGGIGSEKSAARLYHRVGISAWVRVKRVDRVVWEEMFTGLLPGGVKGKNGYSTLPPVVKPSRAFARFSGARGVDSTRKAI